MDIYMKKNWYSMSKTVFMYSIWNIIKARYGAITIEATDRGG